MAETSANTVGTSKAEQEDCCPRVQGDVEEMQSEPGTRKRKADCCDGTNCGPVPKRRAPGPPSESSIVDIPPELETGKFQCACSEWVSLTNESGLTLEPWTAHLAVCEQAKAKGIRSLEELLMPSESSTNVKSNGSATMEVDGHVSPDEIKTESVSEPLKPLPEVLLIKKEVQESKPANGQNTATMAFAVLPEKSIMRESVSKPPTATPEAPPFIAVASSSTIRRVRGPNRSEAERIEEFKSDPQVKEFDPYRVLCRICNKWIKLRNNSRYCSIPWKCHKASCNEAKERTPRGKAGRHSVIRSFSQLSEVAMASGSEATPNIALGPSTEPAATPSEPSQPTVDIAVPPPNVHPSLLVKNISTMIAPSSSQQSPPQTPGAPTEMQKPPIFKQSSPVVLKEKKTITKTGKEPRRHVRESDAAVRRAALEADPYSDIVEPNQILCKLCKKWVKLRPNSSYCSAPWQSHIQRCVAKAERQQPEMKWVEQFGPSPFATAKAATGSASTPGSVDGQQASTGKGEGSQEGNPSAAGDGRVSVVNGPPEQLQTVGPVLETPKKRRGRPPKHLSLSAASKKTTSGDQSDISIESEEDI